MTRSRKGFTLVELLVVIAIIGILIGMLLPAVQQVREAARRSLCMNNIRQIALAAHNYESAHQELPFGVDLAGLPNTTTEELFGWQYYLLPFMEQNNAYEILDAGPFSMLARASDVDDGPNVIAILETQIPGLQCPSDSTTEKLNRHRESISTVINRIAKTNYVGANSIGVVHATNHPTWGAPKGAWTATSNTLLAALKDGTSNTVFISERMTDGVRLKDNMDISHGALQYGCRGVGDPTILNDANDPSLPSPGASDTLFGCGGMINYFDDLADNNIGGHGVSSGHPGGVVVAAADGSGHFIDSQTDSWYLTFGISNPPTPPNDQDGNGNGVDTDEYGTWERLIAINDGEVVDILE